MPIRLMEIALTMPSGSYSITRSLTPALRSAGGQEQAILQGGANTTHTGNPEFDTADFADSTPGNLRVDYVLPSNDLGSPMLLCCGRRVTIRCLIWWCFPNLPVVSRPPFSLG